MEKKKTGMKEGGGGKMCTTFTKTETSADPSVGQQLKLVQGDGQK